MRDEVLEGIFQKKVSIALNFGVGILSLGNKHNCQFKSIAFAEAPAAASKDEADRVKDCPEFDKKAKLTEDSLKSFTRDQRGSSIRGEMSERTKQSIAERSL